MERAAMDVPVGAGKPEAVSVTVSPGVREAGKAGSPLAPAFDIVGSGGGWVPGADRRGLRIDGIPEGAP